MYGLQKITILKKKNENVVPFQNGGQITDFYFASFRFRPKFEKRLSQRNFSIKCGSKNMNAFTLQKIIPFQNGGQNNFFMLRNNPNLC